MIIYVNMPPRHVKCPWTFAEGRTFSGRMSFQVIGTLEVSPDFSSFDEFIGWDGNNGSMRAAPSEHLIGCIGSAPM